MTLDRYTLPPMSWLWSTEHRLNMWAAVAAVQSAAQSKLPPTEQVEWVEQLMKYDVPSAAEVADMESVTGHDVVAFLQLWRERMSPDHARSVHLGLTSSDLTDTALNAVLGQVTDEILEVGETLQSVLATTAMEHWTVERLGRTHGQVAEVTTLGYQLARHCVAINQGLARLSAMMDDLMLFKMSGPVGTYRYTSIEQERRGAVMLGEAFSAASIACQRLPREAYARWVSELAIIASSVEDLGLQVRLGQQFGFEELSEPFRSSQVGSSSMPHKRNPIRSENLTGLARLVRAQIVPVMEGVPTWSERDISHSSVERVALQTASVLTHFMLVGASNLIMGLQVHKDRMKSNIDRAGNLPRSAAYKVELVKAGVSPNQVDALVDGAIRERTVGAMLVENLRDHWNGIAPTFPPMRVEHVFELMQEFSNVDR